MQTFVRIADNHIAEPLAENQRLCTREELPENEDWRPLIVENPIYDRMRFRRNDATTTYVIHPDRVVRSHGLDPIAVTVEMIKAECQRRIIAMTGAHDLTHCMIKQSNANMRANEINDKRLRGEALTLQEEAEANALRALADAIKGLRAKSNALEAMSPIPDDYLSDHYWS